ncbi:hypothetical protein B0H10DRAFT_1944873 [Mycena sp. CBHHK59/15]|nr:hypothetical protein B0H10DRAFT_1944873 [Mycena sp. CBHHK59/15]
MSRAEKFRARKNGAPPAPTPDQATSHTHAFSVDSITGRTAEAIKTFVDRVSGDAKWYYRERLDVEPPSPVKRQRLDEEEARRAPPAPPAAVDPPFFADDPGRYQMGFDEDDPPDAPMPRPRAPPVVKPSDPAADACIRCKDCFGDELLCGTCCVSRHAENPLHRVEKWTGSMFIKWSLKQLGLHVQLGHPCRSACPEPHALHVDFVVLHTNGIHKVNVDTCDCENALLAGAPEEQMLRAG